jgi:hypothetical protein
LVKFLVNQKAVTPKLDPICIKRAASIALRLFRLLTGLLIFTQTSLQVQQLPKMDSTLPLLAVFAPTLYILGAVASLVQFQVVLMLIQQVSKEDHSHRSFSTQQQKPATAANRSLAGCVSSFCKRCIRWGFDAWMQGAAKLKHIQALSFASPGEFSQVALGDHK